MALQVGIHEPVVLGSKTGMNDKGSLVINFATKIDNTNMLAAMESGADIAGDEASLIQFKPNTSISGKALSAGEIGNAVTALKSTLTDILAQFVVEDRAKELLDLQKICFAGLGVTPENLPNKLVSQDFLDVVYNNMCKAFLAGVAPFINGPTLRIKLIRTSKAKHFAKIPAKGKVPSVWIESTNIPKSASKIGWSEYEIKEGLNSSTPTPTEKAEESSAQQAAVQFAAPATGVAPAINPFQQS